VRRSSTPAARLDIDASMAAGERLGTWLRSVMSDELGLDEPNLCRELELAVHEIWMNIVEHSYSEEGGTVTITADREGGEVIFELFDSGCDFDPLSVPDPRPDREQVRGFGLYIVRSIMDRIVYEHTPDGNRWELTRSVGVG